MNQGLHKDYPRIYQALKKQGHDPAKAIEIILAAKRKDKYSVQWIKAIHRLSR